MRTARLLGIRVSTDPTRLSVVALLHELAHALVTRRLEQLRARQRLLDERARSAPGTGRSRARGR